ncbi:MAG: hypothetical protein HRU15_04725, partial [Planctomycetes bacterium]|nr:hypothetical protein [Planctomycetota bacterium]
NKPKDNDIPASESNWNTKDTGRFAYFYSLGEETDKGEESWLHHKE